MSNKRQLQPAHLLLVDQVLDGTVAAGGRLALLIGERAAGKGLFELRFFGIERLQLGLQGLAFALLLPGQFPFRRGRRPGRGGRRGAGGLLLRFAQALLLRLVVLDVAAVLGVAADEVLDKYFCLISLIASTTSTSAGNHSTS